MTFIFRKPASEKNFTQIDHDQWKTRAFQTILYKGTQLTSERINYETLVHGIHIAAHRDKHSCS